MANLNHPSKHAIVCKALEGEPSTEQEHKESCDINKMLRDAARGKQVRGGGSTVYGYDDIGMDATAARIAKAGLEEALLNGQKEFSQNELDLIPKHLQEKFGFKLKKDASDNGPQNDDQTTNKGTKKKHNNSKPKNSPPAEPVDSASSESSDSES